MTAPALQPSHEPEQRDDPRSALGGLTFEARLDRELEAVRVLLLAKNRAYGNSALEPVRVFSQADAVEQIKVRLDDKISRLVRGQAAGEDVEGDLLGYLFLLRIARRLRADQAETGAAAADANGSAAAADNPEPTANARAALCGLGAHTGARQAREVTP